MKKLFSKFLIWIFGWKFVGQIPKEAQKCVLVSGPHTSNWDTYFAVAAMHSLGIPMKVAIKKFWMRFPQKLIIGPIGGIGIDTNAKIVGKKVRQVDLLADLFNTRDRIALMISPEGNRSYTDKWKMGFLMIARIAKVPVVVAYLDYDKKEAGFGPVFSDLEDKKGIMKEISDFYLSKGAKYPEQFAVDKRYN